jgi:hypothetical protein
MAERGQLSDERLKLIRSFMGEPVDEGEERSDAPVPVQPLDSARPSPPARRRTSSHRATVRPERKLITGLGRFLRHHFRSRWPIAAILLGVIVGALIARVA